VAVVSGRAIENLERFGFPETFMVAGSHGAERRGTPFTSLSTAESRRLDRLRMLAERAAIEAGAGSWVESKPTSVVLHVREADPEMAAKALDALSHLAGLVSGAQVKRGHRVVELATRPASKAAAIAAMRLDVPPASVVFLGDDVTDEDVFAALTNGDLGIRVGPGDTAAARRLGDPNDVLTFVRRLVTRLPTRAR
jgi:trehalose-phosphatase